MRNFLPFLIALSCVLLSMSCQNDDTADEDSDFNASFSYSLADEILDNPSATMALLIHNDAGDVVYYQLQDKQLLQNEHSFEAKPNERYHASLITQFYRDLSQSDTLYEIISLTDIQSGDRWTKPVNTGNGSLRTIKLSVQGIQTLDSLRISHFNNNNAVVDLSSNTLQLTFNRYENSMTYVLIAANGEAGFRYFLNAGEQTEFIQTFEQLPRDLNQATITFDSTADWNGNIRAIEAANPDKYLRFFHIEHEPMQARPPLFGQYIYYLPTSFNPSVYDIELYVDGQRKVKHQLANALNIPSFSPNFQDGDFAVLMDDAFATKANNEIDVYYANYQLGPGGVADPFIHSSWQLAGRPPEVGQRSIRIPSFPQEVLSAMPDLLNEFVVAEVELEVAKLSVPLTDIRWQAAGTQVFSQQWKEEQGFVSEKRIIK